MQKLAQKTFMLLKWTEAHMVTVLWGHVSLVSAEVPGVCWVEQGC